MKANTEAESGSIVRVFADTLVFTTLDAKVEALIMLSVLDLPDTSRFTVGLVFPIPTKPRDVIITFGFTDPEPVLNC